MDGAFCAGEAPAATVVIVTRDRLDVLLEAVASTLMQTPPVELLVIDDGSRDGTAAGLAVRFPSVRVIRHERSAGLVVRRTQAAGQARGSVIVSIDDDATFSTPDVVAQTLADFDDPRIAGVAIPYVDVHLGTAEHQRAPSPTGRWILPTFRGTAYALRREAFLDVGGYRGLIFHQGEEADLSLRLLARGGVIRAGRADAVLHFASPKRSVRRMDVYGRRNELLHCFTYFPAPWHLAFMAGYVAKGVRFGLRERRLRPMLAGIALGLRTSWAHRAERAPVPRAVFRLDRRLRRAGALELAEIAPALVAQPSSAYNAS